MSVIRIEESKMIFEFPKDGLFHIEKCNTYNAIGEGVKVAEFVVNQGKKLVFIEAKQSSPQPGNPEDFDAFISEICDKFRNSLVLYIGIILDKPFASASTLTQNLSISNTKSAAICFYLIIKDHKEEWLPPLDDALNMALLPIRKCFAISRIKVLNDAMARQYSLISGTVT